MQPRGVIFDLDGTLVDSNDAHVRAWSEALDAAGLRLPAGRIAPEIGKGGDQLLPSLLGEQLDPRLAARLRRQSAQSFEAIALGTRFSIIPGASELLSRLRAQGVLIGVATSAAGGNQQRVLDSSGLQLASLAHTIVTGDDAEQTKPGPDVIQLAVERLGLHPSQCVFVGDTPHDGLAAVRAGCAFVGVTSGYHDAEALRAAGARAVYGHTAHLLERLDEFLAASFPLRMAVDGAWLQELMDEALQQAQLGMRQGEVPIGAVVADGDGQVLARSHERIRKSGNMTAHAVVLALLETAGRRIGFEGHEVVIATTVEPCRMCVAAAIEGRADLLVYGMGTESRGGRGVRPGGHAGAWMPRIIGGVRAAECRALLHQWLEAQSQQPSVHRRFVRELLDDAPRS